MHIYRTRALAPSLLSTHASRAPFCARGRIWSPARPQHIPYSSMRSHGDAQKAPWVAYGHAQSNSDDRLTANPGRLAVEALQQFLQQKDCCRGLYSTHTLSHGPISSTPSLQHSTVYSSTAFLQSTTSTTPLCGCPKLQRLLCSTMHRSACLSGDKLCKQGDVATELYFRLL